MRDGWKQRRCHRHRLSGNAIPWSWGCSSSSAPGSPKAKKDPSGWAPGSPKETVGAPRTVYKESTIGPLVFLRFLRIPWNSWGSKGHSDLEAPRCSEGSSVATRGPCIGGLSPVSRGFQVSLGGSLTHRIFGLVGVPWLRARK